MIKIQSHESDCEKEETNKDTQWSDSTKSQPCALIHRRVLQPQTTLPPAGPKCNSDHWP